jgi:membrane associated rhomboid family serine protease
MRYTSRSYGNPYGSLPNGVKWLLYVNVGMFLLYYLISPLAPHMRLLMLSPQLVLKHFAVWQLVTYLFLHDGVLHILFNMLALWMFGSTLEADWGTKRFLKYYFLCGIGAGLCDVTLNAVLGNWNTSTLGASGAIYGLLLAFGLLYPDAPVVFFIFPMKAKYLVMIFGGLALLGALRPGRGVSDVAHLGGMVFGYLYLRARFLHVDFGYFHREYQAWKLRRAKKRFQVYMRKHGSDRDTFVN